MRFFQYLWLFLTLLISSHLLVWRMGEKSFWCDELFTLEIASNSLLSLFKKVANDLHPPLYFLIIRGWVKMIGKNESSLRLASLFFALTGLWLTWCLGRKIVGGRIYEGWSNLSCLFSLLY